MRTATALIVQKRQNCHVLNMHQGDSHGPVYSQQPPGSRCKCRSLTDSEEIRREPRLHHENCVFEAVHTGWPALLTGTLLARRLLLAHVQSGPRGSLLPLLPHEFVRLLRRGALQGVVSSTLTTPLTSTRSFRRSSLFLQSGNMQYLKHTLTSISCYLGPCSRQRHTRYAFPSFQASQGNPKGHQSMIRTPKTPRFLLTGSGPAFCGSPPGSPKSDWE